MKWLIGLAQRRISSTASGSSSGCARSCLPLAGVLGEGEQAAADRVARGLVARLDEQLAVGDELLLGERLPVDLALDQLAHQIVLRIGCAVASIKRPEVARALRRARA